MSEEEEVESIASSPTPPPPPPPRPISQDRHRYDEDDYEKQIPSRRATAGGVMDDAESGRPQSTTPRADIASGASPTPASVPTIDGDDGVEDGGEATAPTTTIGGETFSARVASMRPSASHAHACKKALILDVHVRCWLTLKGTMHECSQFALARYDNSISLHSSDCWFNVLILDVCLCFISPQIVTVLGEDAGWLMARNSGGDEGYIPPTFVDFLEGGAANINRS